MMGVNLPSDLIEFPTIRKLREAREEGEQRGEQRGRQGGMLSTLFGLVRDGILGVSDAAKRAGLSTKAFNA